MTNRKLHSGTLGPRLCPPRRQVRSTSPDRAAVIANRDVDLQPTSARHPLPTAGAHPCGAQQVGKGPAGRILQPVRTCNTADMGKWTSRRVSAQDETHEATAATTILAPRQIIWEIIKPAENAPLLDPQITRAFKAEGTPIGIGEIQVFIYTINGIEHITAAEIIDEVPAEYAITRSIGGEFSTRVGYFLTDTDEGTRFELRHRVSIPGHRVAQSRHLLHQYEMGSRATLRRVKVIAESRWENRSPGLRAWNGEQEQD